MQEDIELIANQTFKEVNIPDALLGKNLVIEISDSNALKKMKTYFPTTLKLRMYENLGEIKVVDLDSKPLPMSYVKVYGRKSASSTATFFKDGYTDLRGRFNYAEFSGSADAASIQTFAIFVISECNGSLIKEARNPRSVSNA